MVQIGLFTIIAVLNAALIIMKKNNKIIAVISILVLSIIMAFANTEFGDLFVYSTRYSNLAYSGNMEFGFILYYKLFSTIGLSFNIFRLITFYICCALVCSFIKRYTGNFHLIILLYMFTFFVFLAIALRNSISVSIIVFSIGFLIDRKRIKFIIAVLIAASFHVSSLLALSFMLYYLSEDKKNKLVKYAIRLSVLAYATCVFMVLRPSIINKIALFLNTLMLRYMSGFERTDILANKYLSGTYSFDNLLYLVVYGFNVILARSAYNNIMKFANEREDYVKCTQCCIFIVYISALVLPGIILNQTLIRLLFPGTIICFLLYTIEYFNLQGYKLALSIGERLSVKGVSPVVFYFISGLLWYYAIYGRHALSMDLVGFVSNSKIF